MLSFLSAEAIYCLLPVTTFASVGLLGLWAATSRWHPFIRTTIVLAILSVLLLRPMFEPFVMLVSQVATIAAGVAVYRWLRSRTQRLATESKRTRYQFSLQTLLFVSTLAALAAAVWAKTPVLGWRVWLGYLGVGSAAGVGTLCVALVAASIEKWWIRLISLLGAIIFCALAFTPSMFAHELATDPNHAFGRSGLLLTSVFTTIQLLTQLVIIRMWRGRTRSEIGKSEWWNRRIARPTAIALCSLLFTLPSYVTWRLLKPLPPLVLNTMTPNSFDELTKLGDKLGRSPLITAYNADPIDMSRLASELANHHADYEQLDRLLKTPCVIPDPMRSWELSLIDWRSLARASVAKTDVARASGRLNDSLEASQQTLSIARGLRGGIFSDYLMGLAIEGMGVYGIFKSCPDFNAVQCQHAIDALRMHDGNREAFSDVALRDQRYIEHAEGWWGHLHPIIYGLVGDRWRNSSYIEGVLFREQATLRLLMVELALRNYQLTQNALPDRLDQLVPAILPEIPRDPFDPAGGPLRYKKMHDGYLLYSVSQNRVDDGGVPPNESEATPADWSFWWQDEHGDLRLDHYFAEEEPTPTPNSDTSDEQNSPSPAH